MITKLANMKVLSSRARKMVEEDRPSIMGTFMKGNGLMVNLKAKELSIILMGFNFRVNGIMDKKMESGLNNIQINRPTREIL